LNKRIGGMGRKRNTINNTQINHKIHGNIRCIVFPQKVMPRVSKESHSGTSPKGTQLNIKQRQTEHRTQHTKQSTMTDKRINVFVFRKINNKQD
jgi:hypothetical protein